MLALNDIVNALHLGCVCVYVCVCVCVCVCDKYIKLAISTISGSEKLRSFVW